MSRAIIGLDFGSSALKAAVCEGGKVLRLVEEPMPEQLVRGGVITSPEAMSEFLKETLKKNRISARRAAALLPSSQVFLQQSELPAMTESQLKLNLPYNFRDFISENWDQYFYDYAVIEMRRDEDGKPKTMQLLTAAVHKDIVHSYESLCRWAGLKLVTAIPVEMAYANLLRQAQKQGASQTCIIDCGHMGQRIYFYNDGIFETAQEGDQGGASLDGLLADILDTDVHIAHVRKESNAQGELALPEVRSHLWEAMQETMRAVKFYHFSNPDRQLEGGYVCGGGSRISFVKRELSELLEIPVEPITELLGQVPDPNLAMSCAAAIGAALQ